MLVKIRRAETGTSLKEIALALYMFTSLSLIFLWPAIRTVQELDRVLHSVYHLDIFSQLK